MLIMGVCHILKLVPDFLTVPEVKAINDVPIDGTTVLSMQCGDKTSSQCEFNIMFIFLKQYWYPC